MNLRGIKMENRSYLGSITKYKEIGEGAFSRVYLADYYGGMTVAYKDFLCKEETLKKMQPNIEKLTKISDSELILPFKLIYEKKDDKLFKGYLMDYLYNYSNITKINNLDYNKKLEILRSIREKVELFHEKYNMLHGDICPWNIMYNKEQNIAQLIDFDLSIDLSNKENIAMDNLNELAEYYVKYVGVDKDLDIFLFNLTTYSFLNEKGYLDSFDEIEANKFGIIENNNAIDILKGYKDLRTNKTLKKEYVIDYL